jgi:hypothetical protein
MSDEKAPGGEGAPAPEGKAAAPRPSAKVRWIVRLFVLVFCLGLAEVAARLGGHRPWDPEASLEKRMIVVPGPALFSRDEDVGHALMPGMHMVTYGYSTNLATHLDKYRRLTRPYDMPPPAPDAKSLWFFGDSYTYGGSISDNEAYPYRVQVKHPELNVVDYAWPGQSSIQTVLLLKKLLASGEKPPNVAFMGYASFHDGRTLMARGNRKAWHPYRSRYPTFPAARLEDGKLVTKWVKVDYDPLPLEQYSAFMELVATYYNKADVVLSHGKEVSQGVIQELNDLCKEHGIHFVLLGIHNSARTKEMVQWASSKGIHAADISGDESKPENVVYGDGHPSGKATLQFAEKLDPVIKEALAAKP